ncbi:hypothetical protein QBC44DRAFT_28490 [Cladorrhinum sp. PSN332]|nr:hypothetical protein QBC44DRAFT_28490 [Cladorrhinum sp. PSN332]
MSRLPFLEVEHLPSSSSFYSAVLQPLDLFFLGSERGHFPVSTYGNPSGEPILQLRQVVASRDRPLKRSRIVLSAPSAAATDEAFKFARRANPDLEDEHLRHPDEAYPAPSGVSAHRRIIAGGGLHVFISDFDENIMEIVYQPPPQYPSHYNGSTVRQTRSTSQEASRILTWNFDVAGSSAPSPVGPGTAYSGPARAAPRQPAGYLEDAEEPQPALRRSLTTSNSTYEPAASARENSTGLSAGAVVGTLLGVAAAGAAALTTYNMVKSDRRAPYSGDYDSPASFSRRSTIPDKYDPYSDRKGRYSDLDYSADRPRYSEDYPSTSDYRRPPPDYIARYSQVDSPSRSRGMDDDYFDDSRGRHSSSRSRTSLRPRSEAANDRDPYLTAETEQRAWSSSKPSRHPPIVQRSYTYDTPEKDTYVSSRTIRAPPPDPYMAPPVSRSGSRVTTTTYKVTGGPRAYDRQDSYSSSRYAPIADSRPPAYLSRGYSDMPSTRTGTYFSSRQPLPRSASGGHSRWEPEEDDDDDADSIAPSDSISCVGSRRSR